MNKLIPPTNIHIDFKPSPKQYEVWKALQPECPDCGGEIEQVPYGTDKYGNTTYHPQCTKCKTFNIPQFILTGGAAGGGKMLSINSLVCTPFGFRPLKELKKGDIISNPLTGGQQRVLQIHPKGRHNFYRVHFIDRTYTDCSEGHLWRAHVSRNKSKKAKRHPEHYAEYGDDRIMETADMYQWYQRKKDGMYKGTHLIIPLTKPVEFTNSTQLPIEPYILGALIGDGCMSNTLIERGCVEMVTMDEEIRDRFIQAGYDMSHWQKKQSNQALSYTIRDQQLIEQLIELGIAGNKSADHVIPRRYMVTSIKNRIELMQGLMDTDGYVDARGHMVYSTISEQLAEDVAWVVRSLGGVATVSKSPAGYKGSDGEYIQCRDVYDVQIRSKLGPELCGLTRKKERAKYEFNGGVSELGKRITDIEYIGEQESFCITVDDPSGLYITDNFTVTHNSYLMSAWLIYSCLRFPGIRTVVARKTLKSLKESTVVTIRRLLHDWGLKEEENYHINNLEGSITFWNDSKIMFLEMADNPSDAAFNRFGSMEVTAVVVDEVSEISEKACEVLFSRIRFKTHETFKVPKMVMSTNPCTTWVRDRFVQDENGEPVQCREGERYIPFGVEDNPDEKFRMTYMASLDKISDPAVKARLRYGNWDFPESNDSAAYWSFDGGKHLVTELKEKAYNPLQPLVLSFDFNVAPYMSCLISQIDYDKKKVYILEEIMGRPEEKENNTPKFAEKIKQHLISMGHVGGIVITGDPAGRSRATASEEGVNNYSIIMSILNIPQLRPKQQLLSKQPAQKTRLEFVNAVLAGNTDWDIFIDLRCRKLTDDLINQRKEMDGSKSKAKINDPKLGIKYEKYGHFSDALDYFLVLFLDKQWKRFTSQGSSGVFTTNGGPIYSTFSY